MDEALILLQIIKDYIRDKKCYISKKVDENKLFQIANIHNVSNFLQTWANEYATKELKDKVDMDFNKQILKDTNQSIEFENLLNRLEESDIKTLVFKGFLTKSLYPQEYMRKMCDIDILVEKQNLKKTSQIIKDLGFERFNNYEKHLSFVKNILVIIELHRDMTVPEDVGYEYFINILDKAIKYENYKNIYQMNLEDSYLFSIVHLLIHFKENGITIRDVLDIYLFNEKFHNFMDYEKLNKVLEELEIKSFEKEIREIAYKWFESEKEIKKEELGNIEKYILSGPSTNKCILNTMIKDMNKQDVVFRLFFPEFKVMKNTYPILRKTPVLLPFVWIYRIIRGVFEKTITLKDRFKKIDLVKNVKEEDIDNIKDIYKKLEI